MVHVSKVCTLEAKTWQVINLNPKGFNPSKVNLIVDLHKLVQPTKKGNSLNHCYSLIPFIDNPEKYQALPTLNIAPLMTIFLDTQIIRVLQTLTCLKFVRIFNIYSSFFVTAYMLKPRFKLFEIRVSPPQFTACYVGNIPLFD